MGEWKSERAYLIIIYSSLFWTAEDTENAEIFVKNAFISLDLDAVLADTAMPSPYTKQQILNSQTGSKAKT